MNAGIKSYTYTLVLDGVRGGLWDNDGALECSAGVAAYRARCPDTYARN
jgi:hypothetical protein